MAISERMKMLFDRSRAVAINPPRNTFARDLHSSALTLYKDLPTWEKQARAMAYAIVNQEIYIEDYDKIIGRVYYQNEIPPENYDPDFDFNKQPRVYAEKNDLEYAELCRYQLATWGSAGHIAWDWNALLRRGTEGLRERCNIGLERHKGDEEAEHFYKGVLITLEALELWNDKHVERLIEMGKTEEAEICKRVPRYPARTFREALQCFFMQFIIVMKENPYGGNSPGRLDYYLWPFLESDLKNGIITMEEAEELCEELFVRIDERLYHRDTWGESVVLGGCHPNGTSAVNPLTYAMLRAYMKYDIIHPLVYGRIPKDPPEEYIELLTDYVINGRNRAQLICDEAAIDALVKNGVNETDAADYYCGGCMEIGIQGRTSDFLFTGYQNIAKMLELCMSGGYCLMNKKQLDYIKIKSLKDFDSFEDFYSHFIAYTDKWLTRNLEYQDKLSEHVEKKRPSYLLSSMVNDCLAKGRNMHGGGARYHDYGSALVGVPNAADALTAIKIAVFEKKLCTADELLNALKANFDGYEKLHAKLLALPKYGQENKEADAMCARITVDLNRIYSSYVNRFGGNGKLVMLTFVWAPVAGGILGATPDGRKAGLPVAHSMTPQSMAMTKGITAAINSCTTLPFELFTGGASTMWDLDPSFATPEIVSSLFKTFFEQGGQIFQGNMTDVDELRKALESPDQYKHLIVRVGGYSARFVNLNRALQEEIINRLRHSS